MASTQSAAAPAETRHQAARFSHRLPPSAVLLLLAAAAVAAVAVFLLIDLRGNIGYVLSRRAVKVGAMVVVAAAVGISTLMFQTVTSNRILTPSIMGFDSLYILVQTSLVFTLGATGVVTAPPLVRFAAEVALMVAFSALLYRWMFTGGIRSLHLLLMVGIVLGTLFRGVSSLLQRLMQPSEFIILQDLFFASFNSVEPSILGISAVAVLAAGVYSWRLRHQLDVIALGRDLAIGVGVDHRRTVMAVLLICSLLVAVSTALVGPVTFFGLLVVSLAYQFCRGFSHRWLLPMVTLIGIVTLVGGQLALERIFGFDTALSVIIEFTGGLLFLFLLLRNNLK